MADIRQSLWDGLKSPAIAIEGDELFAAAYYDRFEQIRRLLYLEKNCLRCDRADYEPKDGLIKTVDISLSGHQTSPALREKMAKGIMNEVGLSGFSVESRLLCIGKDLNGWDSFVERLYIYPAHVAAVSLEARERISSEEVRDFAISQRLEKRKINGNAE